MSGSTRTDPSGEDLFASKLVKPMLIGAEGKAFDDPEYLFELKLDGERCIAYLDPRSGTELRNKRHMKMLSKVPELSQIHQQVNKPCILDGELIVMVDGKPNFSEIQRRSLMSNQIKIELAAAKHPASFTAYDILYLDGQLLTDRPLTERKKLLSQTVKYESPFLALSRVIEGRGIALYQLAEQQGLEGIVAKRRDSRYFFAKRTKDWIKIKNLQDDDFVVCGYIHKDQGVVSIVLGQYADQSIDQSIDQCIDRSIDRSAAQCTGRNLIYKGHVTMGISREDFATISSHPRIDAPDFLTYPDKSSGNDRAIWLRPDLVCTVKYMELNAAGGLRQPVFKGLRNDKKASDCIVPSSV